MNRKAHIFNETLIILNQLISIALYYFALGMLVYEYDVHGRLVESMPIWDSVKQTGVVIGVGLCLLVFALTTAFLEPQIFPTSNVKGLCLIGSRIGLLVYLHTYSDLDFAEWIFVQFSIDLVVRVFAMIGHVVMTCKRKGESYGCIFYYGIFLVPGIVVLFQSAIKSVRGFEGDARWIAGVVLVLMIICSAAPIAQGYFELVKSSEEESSYSTRARWKAEAKAGGGRVMAIALLLIMPVLCLSRPSKLMEELEKPWSWLMSLF